MQTFKRIIGGREVHVEEERKHPRLRCMVDAINDANRPHKTVVLGLARGAPPEKLDLLEGTLDGMGIKPVDLRLEAVLSKLDCLYWRRVRVRTLIERRGIADTQTLCSFSRPDFITHLDNVLAAMCAKELAKAMAELGLYFKGEGPTAP